MGRHPIRYPGLRSSALMAKREISWKRRTEDGEKQEVYVRHIGDQWTFFVRTGRNDQWRVLADPPLQYWLILLDAKSRRTERQLFRPEEETQLKKLILRTILRLPARAPGIW